MGPSGGYAILELMPHITALESETNQRIKSSFYIGVIPPQPLYWDLNGFPPQINKTLPFGMKLIIVGLL